MQRIPYNPDTAALAAEMMQLTIGLMVGLLVLLYLSYFIFEAIGLYGVSKGRGYKNAWFSCIPIFNSYVLGGIADNINSCFGRRSSYRVWVLVTRVFSSLSMAVTLLFLCFNFVPMFAELMQGGPDALSGMLSGGVYQRYILLCGFNGMLSLANIIVQALALSKIYRDYLPNAATYLVLSLLIPLLLGLHVEAFFIYYLRNKPSVSLSYRAGARPPVYPYTPPYPPAR